jgi:regulatory protein
MKTVHESLQQPLAPGDPDLDRLYDRVLNFLSYRPRSVKEVRDYLRKRNAESEIVDALIARLEAAGFLDDREFAEFWVSNRQRFSPRGDRGLTYELRNKGISRELIDEQLEGLSDEVSRASTLLRAKFQPVDDADFEAHEKLARYLIRRGFRTSSAWGAVKRFVSDVEPGGE